jgi:hypothetical protein
MAGRRRKMVMEGIKGPQSNSLNLRLDILSSLANKVMNEPSGQKRDKIGLAEFQWRIFERSEVCERL